jgi:hypothetical protein
VLLAVHEEGYIHRDIKPENVMLRKRDGKPVLIDFGAVKEVITTIVDAHGTPTSSIVIGSPGFMPLEQAAGKPVYSSDLYSLGLTAIFLLTGRRPRELTDLHTGEIVWRNLAPVNPEFADLIEQAIQPIARDRFRGAQQMLELLKNQSDSEDINAPQAGEYDRTPHTQSPPEPTIASPSADLNPQTDGIATLHASVPDLIARDLSFGNTGPPARHQPSHIKHAKLRIDDKPLWSSMLIWGFIGLVSSLVVSGYLSLDLFLFRPYFPEFWLYFDDYVIGAVYVLCLATPIYMFGQYSSERPLRRRKRILSFAILIASLVVGVYLTKLIGLGLDGAPSLSNLLWSLLFAIVFVLPLIGAEHYCWDLRPRRLKYSLVIVGGAMGSIVIGDCTGYMLALVDRYAAYAPHGLVFSTIFFWLYFGVIFSGYGTPLLISHVLALKSTKSSVT